MTHWQLDDKAIQYVGAADKRASNNITRPGILIADLNPTGTPSRTVVQAHFKALRAYRKW